MTAETETNKLDYPDAFSKMSEEEIEQWKKDALARPPSFAYRGDKDMFVTWSMGPVLETRDSGIRDKANSKCIKEMLAEDPSLDDDWEVACCGHWLSGWIEQLSFRVLEDDGSLTRMSRVIKGIYDGLSEHPVLDDSLYSEMEYDDTLSNIENHWSAAKLKDELPDDWPSKMYGWWHGNDDYDAIDDPDGRSGGCPNEDQFEECARALGFWDTSDDDE